MKSSIASVILLGALAACQTVEPEPVLAADPEDHALAQAACGSCHSVEPYGLSPNPDAPEWPAIANRRGVTRETLTMWLVDAHNYPGEMDFYLEEDEVEQLVDYMLTLRREDYHPPY
ncbi:c-type cytochrome [Aurantiacibacter odishensis]|uniref:c-type cytochrome n=1 Tax=Aurantiacibacter odishensis TaxID=1155476 RepID=UPI001F0C6667|nr:c-type cytochrome [Aurantiacibacter odishensis]